MGAARLPLRSLGRLVPVRRAGADRHAAVHAGPGPGSVGGTRTPARGTPRRPAHAGGLRCLARLRRHGPAQQRHPVQPDLLGPDPDHRRSGVGPQRHGTPLDRAARPLAHPRRAADARQACGRGAGPGRDGDHGRSLGPARPRRRSPAAPGRARGCPLLRHLRHLRPPLQGDAASGDGRLTAHGLDRDDPAAGPPRRPALDLARSRHHGTWVLSWPWPCSARLWPMSSSSASCSAPVPPTSCSSPS